MAIRRITLTPEETADAVVKELAVLESKYNIEFGCWMTWRDLARNLDHMKEHAEFNELKFGVEIRLKS